ncbi:hypothetical protein [Roseovarius confluentis]|uniref:hypothetical protein n=1 Tax=Roseovarius confluentis TaxID=1852027 RepID=UPI003BA9E576
MAIREQLYNLPLELQTALAGGYLAYWIAYTGLDRNPRAIEVAFRTFAFGLPAVAAFRMALEISPAVAVAAGIASAITCAALWRVVGRSLTLWALEKLGVLGDDGLDNAWTALIQQRKLTVGQLSVHTKDGRVLYQNGHEYPEAHLGGMYFGQDGSIVMVVEEEELHDGTEEKREGITDPNWGTRVTYIPADQIARVNMR